MQKTTAFLPLLSALLLCAAMTDVQAQWTWRDASGRVTASDRPPPREIPDKDIISRPSGEARRPAAPPPAIAASGAVPALPAAAASAAKGPLDRELEARKRAADQEQAARAKAKEERLAAQRAENCRRARSHLAALESGQRIVRLNDRGEREVLEDRGRADETRQARDVIATDCR